MNSFSERTFHTFYGPARIATDPYSQPDDSNPHPHDPSFRSHLNKIIVMYVGSGSKTPCIISAIN
jgi:hypothetical protein